MDIKEIKIAKGTKITRAVDKLNNDVARRTLVRATTIRDDNGHTVDIEGCGLYLTNEGRTWVRGWEGKIVRAFKRTITAEDRKAELTRAKQERERDKERAMHAIKSLQQAADVVKRAKLPRELRVAAFVATLGPFPTMAMMGPWSMFR
jgi:hypothetical protein